MELSAGGHLAEQQALLRARNRYNINIHRSVVSSVAWLGCGVTLAPRPGSRDSNAPSPSMQLSHTAIDRKINRLVIKSPTPLERDHYRITESRESRVERRETRDERTSRSEHHTMFL